MSSLGEIDESLFHEISADVDFNVGDLTVHPFHISHDANDPVAYRVSDGTRTVAVATDMGTYDAYTVRNLQNVDGLLLESNHDIRMLEVGPYPYPLKARVAGDYGHLSNEWSGRLLSEILHDDTVRAKLVEDRQLLDGGWKLVVVHERVEGDVHLLAAGCARVCDQLSQLVRGEVDGLGARRESVEPKVYGVRARREGGAGCLKGAGWCKQFCFAHGVSILP